MGGRDEMGGVVDSGRGKGGSGERWWVGRVRWEG